MAATDGDAEYVDRPLVEPGTVERRRYQLELAETAAEAHTLVCLPTGLGKTTVSLLVTAERLHAEPDGRALLLAPTKPLVEQHAAFYRKALTVPDEEIVVFTGEVRPDDRAALWEDARVVIATPQVVENDLVGGRISLADVVHLTFDECHRATGDYAYTYIAERYHPAAGRQAPSGDRPPDGSGRAAGPGGGAARPGTAVGPGGATRQGEAADPLVTGMSASPGGDEEAILEVCANLGVEAVEVMTREDADVDEYSFDTDLTWERIELPEDVLALRDLLNDVISDRLTRLKELGVVSTTRPDVSQRELNQVRGKLQRLIEGGDSKGYKGMSVHAEVMKLRQAVTYVETQSVESLRRYFERQRNAAGASGASKATQRFVSEPRVTEAMRLAEEYDDLHPKFRRARMLLAETLGIEGGDRVIVFTESRDTAETLTAFLGEHFETRRFVGQGDREGSDGMTQTAQQETLEAFRAGEFEVLVSTSVAEEGLDVPEVDLVLFYEPVPTAIRSIQRKGRTGRQTEGRVVVLVAEDTRDEAYFWKSRQEETRMEEELRALKDVADDLTATLGGSQGAVGDFDEAPGDGAAGASANGGSPGALDDEAAGRDGQSGLTDFGTDPDDGTAADRAGGEATADRGDRATAGRGDRATADREGSPAEDGDAAADDAPGADAADDTPGGADAAGDDDGEEAVVARPGGEEVEIVVDQRELDSNVARDLSKRGAVDVRLETLEVGDYVLSDRVVVERKTVADFLDSLLGDDDRSVFEQAGDMARHYTRPVVLVEGEADLYGERNVHPNAIRGALASLAVDFDASVLRTRDEADTAGLLAVLADREQSRDDREVRVHGGKAQKTLAEQQEYVVSAIADVGPVTARSLLDALGSVEAVMTADEEALLDVDGVGEVTASRIRDVVGSEYEG